MARGSDTAVSTRPTSCVFRELTTTTWTAFWGGFWRLRSALETMWRDRLRVARAVRSQEFLWAQKHLEVKQWVLAWVWVWVGVGGGNLKRSRSPLRSTSD